MPDVTPSVMPSTSDSLESHYVEGRKQIELINTFRPLPVTGFEQDRPGAQEAPDFQKIGSGLLDVASRVSGFESFKTGLDTFSRVLNETGDLTQAAQAALAADPLIGAIALPGAVRTGEGRAIRSLKGESEFILSSGERQAAAPEGHQFTDVTDPLAIRSRTQPGQGSGPSRTFHDVTGPVSPAQHRALLEQSRAFDEVILDLPSGHHTVSGPSEVRKLLRPQVELHRMLSERLGTDPEKLQEFIQIEADAAGVTVSRFQRALGQALALLKDPADLDGLLGSVQQQIREGKSVTSLPRLRNEKGNIRASALVVLARALAGAAAGGFAGDTPEDRIRNAFIGAGIGAAASPALVSKMGQVIRDETGSVFRKPEPPVRLTSKTAEEAARFAAMDPATIKVGDKALKIDFSALGDPQSIEDAIKKIVTIRGESLVEAKRGIISTQRRQALADALGTTVQDILNSSKGKALNAEEMQAWVDLLGATVRKLTSINDAYQAVKGTALDTGEELRALEHHLAVATQVVEKFYGARGEAGRTLQVLQTAIQAKAQAAGLQDIVDRLRFSPIQHVSDIIGSLKEPEQTGSFLRQMVQNGNFLKALNNLYINSLLMTFQGNAAKLLSEGMAAGNHAAELAVAARISRINPLRAFGPQSEDRIIPQEAISYLRGMIMSFRDGLSVAADHLRTGESMPFGDSGFEAPNVNLNISGSFGRAIDYLAHIVNTPTRVIGTDTAFFKALNYRGVLYQKAIREASVLEQKGLLKAKDREGFIETFLAHPPAFVDREAQDLANVNTFSDELPNRLKALQTAVSHPLARFVIPFFKVPVNLARYTFERFPVLGLLAKRNREMLGKGGVQADLVAAKQAMGTMVAGFVGMMYEADLVTGGGPKEPGLRKEWRKTHEPFSIRIPGTDRWLGFHRIEVYGSLMGTLARAAEVAGHLDADSMEEIAAAISVAFGDNYVSKSYMVGLDQAFKLLASKTPDEFEKNQKIFDRIIASFLVPTALYQFRKEFDPVVREVHTMLDQAVNRLPYFSQFLFPDRYLDGTVVQYPNMLGPDFLSPIPFTKTRQDPVSQEMLDNRISISKPPRHLFGPMPPQIGEVKVSDGVPLTPEQYDRFVQLAGNELKLPASILRTAFPDLDLGGAQKLGMWDALTAMIETKRYKEATPGPDGGKALMMRKIVLAYRQAAERQVISEFPELRQAILEQRIEKAGALAGPKVQADIENRVRNTPALQRFLEGVAR